MDIIRNAAFVDLSNANVLFKQGGKFVVALNFADAVHRMNDAFQALGVGYDIYLCLKPRAPGEGDMVINELSIGGVPFTVDSRELRQVITFFRSFTGVSDVYLCNWLANFTSTSRVSSFESVIYYGNRVAHMTVKGKLVETFKIYHNQQDFYNSMPEGYNCSGDADIVDVDAIKAQYPELSDCATAQLVALAPIVRCYKTPIHIDTQELLERLELEAPPPVVSNEAPEPEPIEEPEEEKPEPTPITYNEEEMAEHLVNVKARKRTPMPVRLLQVASFALALAVGCSAGILSGKADTKTGESYYIGLNNRREGLQELADVYLTAYATSEGMVERFKYCSMSELEVTVVGFEHSGRITEVRCVCASDGVFESFVDYLEKQYLIVETNDLGMVEVNGEQRATYIVSFQ